MISPVVISQGDIRVTVETRNEGVQPLIVAGLANDAGGMVISNSKLSVDQGANDATIKLGSTSIGDLVQGLAGLHVDTRRIISILQAMKSAGALHAEIVVE